MQPPVVISLVVLGYLCGPRRAVLQATSLLFFSMLLNNVLKFIFQVPLLPTVGHPGFAFPSGHMQATVAFYGMLACHTQQRFYRFVLGSLMLTEGYALWYFSYHDLKDIVGAIGVGSLLVYAGQRLFTTRSARSVAAMVLGLASSLLYMSYWQGGLTANIWCAYIALWSLHLGQMSIQER